MRPDTILRWHRDLLARHHAAVSRPERRGRPRTLRSIRTLVLRLADVDLGGIDIDVIGWILIVAGLLGLIMTSLIWGRRRTVVTQEPVEREVVTRDPVEYRRVEERRRDLEPPL